MPLIPINSLADPRVEHYRNLKDRELERRGRRFIAEGEHLVRRLLASDFTTESLLRISAAFGADAMILGEKCHDPFWRQSIRVSMGTIFSLPLVQSQDLHNDLRRLKAQWGVQFAATVLDPSAESLANAKRPPK